jgi:glycosyltransferase involved in cell wall biosynthesis
MHRRLKVLISAYACNPRRGSEHGVGWGWVRMIARRHEVWALTAEFQRADIEHELDASPELRRTTHFCYVPAKPLFYRPTRPWVFIENSPLKPLMNFADSLWLREAFKLARKLHEEVHFDIAHQLTYVGFRFPGWLWRLGVPFVWGPIGGLENTPWRLLPLFGFQGAMYYAVRNGVNSAQKKFLRNPKKAFPHARGGIIAATTGIQKEILRCYSEESDVICEIGVPDVETSSYSTRDPGEPLRIAWSGLHLPGKALPILLRGLHQLPPDVDWQLDILGDGPCTRAWRGLADRLGLGKRCMWHGWLPREESLRLVHRAHLFALTSLKDLTSTVLLEALSQGVPVVALDHCGFSDMVNDDCGIKVPVRRPRQIAAGFTDAIVRVWRDETARRAMAAAAVERARDFSWERKAEALDAIYSRVVGAEGSKVESSGRFVAQASKPNGTRICSD